MEKLTSQINATPVGLLGVEYLHVRTSEGGDLYVTKFGAPFMEQLIPENWKENPWFKENRESLPGTSTVYKHKTKEVEGRSIDLVVKYCRVGEDVPLNTMGFDKFWFAEFNSPYEEFSLLMEMRRDSSGGKIPTHKPLAIYVPPTLLKLWQTGRSKSKIARKTSKFREVELDIYRQYIMIYEWIKGVSAPEALESQIPNTERYKESLKQLTIKVRDKMAEKGFRVIDHKPAHIILRPLRDGSLLRKRTGDLAYALVDFELLERTPAHERDVKTERHKDYLWHVEHRFSPPGAGIYPKHLQPTRVLNVDYVFGHAESTGGILWVVGKDPNLFDYFLPERWRHTPREQMSKVRETFYTVSKDDVHLVWKVSSIGETLTIKGGDGTASRKYEVGYNSPFEAIAIAQELIEKGVSCVYPRAIYMAGLESPHAPDYISDKSCYERHKEILTPEGQPVLRSDHNYITIWGYWRTVNPNPDGTGQVASEALNLLQAEKRGLVPPSMVGELIHQTQQRLLTAGFQADFLIPTHLLISIRPDLTIVQEPDGKPNVTICNFELIRRKQRKESDGTL